MYETQIGGRHFDDRRGANAAEVFAPPVADRAEPEDVQYAGFGARAGAAVIDMIIMQVVTMLINALFIAMLLRNMTDGSVFLATVGPLIVGGAFAMFYTVWLESSPWQATLGKRMLGLKVVDVQGRRISFGKSSWRNMAKGLSMLSLGVGYLMPLWDRRKQAMHDKAVGCLVVRATGEGSPSSSRVAGFA